MDRLDVLDDMPHRLNLSMGHASQEQISPLIFEDAENRSEMMLQLNQLRKNATFCDISLRVEGHEIPVHRNVLVCASPYLFEFLSDEANDRPAVKLPGVDYVPFICLVNFAYTSKLTVPASSVKEVYKAAQFLKMTKAAAACSEWLASHLTPDNCLATRLFANSHCDADLTSKTDEYIQRHITDVQTTPVFLKLPRIQVEVIGADENQLSANNEKHLCKLVIDWMRERSDDESTDNLATLCEHVHMLYLNAESNLQDCVHISDDLAGNNEKILDYKKMSRKRSVANAKVKCNGHVEHAQVNGSSIHIWMERTESPQIIEKENKLVAIHKTSDRSFLCIAVLNDVLCATSLHLQNNEQVMNASFECISDTEGNAMCRLSPRGSPIPLEKLASLTPLETLNQPRCSFGVAILDGDLVVFGGYDRGECLSSVASFNVGHNVWTDLPSMLSARGRFEVAVVQGKVYAAGGSNGHKELSSMEVYDPASQKWSFAAKMSFARCHSGVVALDNKVFVIGGWNGDKMKCLKRCEVYDPATNTWSSIASLQQGRSQPAVCTWEGKIYVFGGANAWDPTNTVEVYDPATGSWRYVSPMATIRRGAAAYSYRGRIYVVGGCDGNHSLATTEVFDPQTETWSLGAPLSMARTNLGMTVVQDRLFVIGGFSGKVFLDTVEYLGNNELSEWCSCVPMEMVANGN